MLTGAATWVAGLGVAPLPPLQAIATAAATLPLALTLHLLLAYPTGRVRGRLARGLVVVGYVVSTVMGAPNYLIGDSRLVIWTSEPARAVGFVLTKVQTTIGVTSMLVAVVIMAHRAWRLSPAERRLAEPMVGYRILCSLVIAVTAGVTQLVPDPGILDADGFLQALAVAGLPVVFLVGLLFGSFGRTGEVNEMMIRLGSSTPTAQVLSQAVGFALEDPEAAVVYARSEGAGFVDASGREVPSPATPTLETFPVTHDGRLVGGIVYRSSLMSDPRVLAVLAGVVAMAIDQQRLLAEQRALVGDLQVRELELRRSRRRLLQAEDEERRRIARDLHDGAQQHLVALGLTSRRISRSTTDPEAAQSAAEVVDGLVDLLAEFRALIAGIMPAPLLERGFLPAIDVLAERMPVPTRVLVTVPPETLPPTPSPRSTSWCPRR